jgi:hypothetical protein
MWYIFFLESTVSCNIGDVISVFTPIHYLDFAPEEPSTGAAFNFTRTVVRSFSSSVVRLCSLKAHSVYSPAFRPVIACRVKLTLYVTPSYALGHAVVQVAEALFYKSEGQEFNSQWCHWNFSLT